MNDADEIARLRAELAAERERVAKLREALMEARDELQAFCEELHGEDYNNTKINAALAETGGGDGA